MSKPRLFYIPIPKDIARRLAKDTFGDMIKFVVDLDRKIIAAGGTLHMEIAALLIENGSAKKKLWGANYYPNLPPAERLVYRSMINIRPADGNTQHFIESESIRQQIRDLALFFFEGKKQ